MTKAYKLCPKCSRIRPRQYFSKNKKRYDRLQSSCKDCMSGFARRWNDGNRPRMQQRARKWRQACVSFIRWLKDYQLCVDCGLRHRFWRLQFDHRDGATKIGNISGSGGFGGRCGIEKLQAEIMKCDLVCANCHADRTYRRMAGKS